MTPEQSLFLAKKKWDENVYSGMRMESRNITFPQTKTILQGVNVPNVQLDDIQDYTDAAENEMVTSIPPALSDMNAYKQQGFFTRLPYWLKASFIKYWFFYYFYRLNII